MSRACIVAVVEGHGEIEAVPLLIRRVAPEVHPSLVLDIPAPIRVPADRFRKPHELERTVELAVRRLEGRGGVFVLIDCDWDNGCPKTDAPPLLKRAQSVRPGVPMSLVLAYREYEAWFIAAAASIRGKHRLSPDLETVANPEGIRGAKEWLSDRMPSNRPYAETIDQPALTAMFDMQAAKRADSFDKCYREIVRLINDVIQWADATLTPRK